MVLNNKQEKKNTFFIHPAFLAYRDLHSWWYLDSQLTNAFESDFRQQFFSVGFNCWDDCKTVLVSTTRQNWIYSVAK